MIWLFKRSLVLWGILAVFVMLSLLLAPLTTQTTLAFIGISERRAQLFITDLPRRITRQQTTLSGVSIYNLNALTWSPDGGELTMEFWDASNPEIFAYDYHTDKITFRYRSHASERYPFWSPDGTMILFSSFSSGSIEPYLHLYHTAPHTTAPLHRAPRNLNFRTITWSPNNRYIAYETAELIYVVEITTANSHPLNIPNRASRNTPLYWTPDSCCIIYHDYESGIYQVRVSDNQITPLLEQNGIIEIQVFDNGKQIAFTQVNDGRIYALNTKTQTTHQVTQIRGNYLSISPTGRYVLHIPPIYYPDGVDWWITDTRTQITSPLIPQTLQPRSPAWQP